MRNHSLVHYLIAILLAAAACTPQVRPDDIDDTSDASVGVDAISCDCQAGPHGAAIYVMSSQSEIYSYNPVNNEFTFLAVVNCPAGSRPFSMAVDENGVAWILFVETRDLNAVDLNDPTVCFDPGFVPSLTDFQYFGMTFSAEEGAACTSLYAHSYSGVGPFSEGPDLGLLGVFDEQSRRITTITAIDYDGGELAGTGDGRLFAFSGADPAKLVEYDKSDGTVIDTLALTGFSKTNASAFALFAGDVYFFTEAQPTTCAPCLDQHCPAAHAACQADEVCAEELACAVERAEINDNCGGLLSSEMQTCVSSVCAEDCLVSLENRVSQVTRLDLSRSDGMDPDPTVDLTVVAPEAPIRIVGAGASTCVPYIP